MNFTELKQKDVINVCDGKRLGRPIDIVLNENACAEAIVVPGPVNIWNCLKPDRDGYIIAWKCIRRIGDDVILVEVDSDRLAY